MDVGHHVHVPVPLPVLVRGVLVPEPGEPALEQKTSMRPYRDADLAASSRTASSLETSQATASPPISSATVCTAASCRSAHTTALGAFGREAPRERPADAAGGAGYYRDLAL